MCIYIYSCALWKPGQYNFKYIDSYIDNSGHSAAQEEEINCKKYNCMYISTGFDAGISFNITELADNAICILVYNSLKNVLIIVNNIDESIDFYEELFGLRVITRQEGNVIMSEGLVLQDVDVWYDSTKTHTTPHNNMTELYFEDNDIEGIIEKLESGKYVVSYVTELMENDSVEK